MNDFLSQDFWGATVGNYLAFAAIVLGALLLKKPFSKLIARLTSRMATRVSGGKYRSLFRSLIRKPLEWLFAVILLFYAFNFISGPLNNVTLMRWHHAKEEPTVSVPATTDSNQEVAVQKTDRVVSASEVVDHLFTFFTIFFIILLLSRLADFIYRAQAERAHHRSEKERAQLLPLIRDVIKIVLWTIGFFWILGVVFYVNIPALITGLGIGGVALALAAKESIENLFASFTILADKPFAVGDSIKLGALEGTAVRIGFRSTRLRTPDGSLLIIPNKKLVDESLENLSARSSLHVRMSIPVKYALPPKNIDDLLTKLRESVSRIPEVLQPVLVAVESFTHEAFVLRLSYELPPSLAEDKVNHVKAEAAGKVYSIITSRVEDGQQ